MSQFPFDGIKNGPSVTPRQVSRVSGFVALNIAAPYALVLRGMKTRGIMAKEEHHLDETLHRSRILHMFGLILHCYLLRIGSVCSLATNPASMIKYSQCSRSRIACAMHEVEFHNPSGISFEQTH